MLKNSQSSGKSMISQKKCLNQNSLKKLCLMKAKFLLSFKETRSALTISEFKVTLSDESVSAVYTTNGTLIRSNETYESHMEFVFFSCFLRLICHLFTFCLFFSAGLSLKFL